MPEPVTIPCAMHRTSHTLTPREAAVVIVTLFGMARDTADDPDGHIAEHDECVREILSAGKDGEGYYEHVSSVLGDDAIDYPDVAEGDLPMEQITGSIGDARNFGALLRATGERPPLPGTRPWSAGTTEVTS